MNEKRRNKNRLTLIALAAVFLVPVLAAMFLNSRWSNWKPEATRNHGTLIRPVLPVAGVPLLEDQRGHLRWTLVSVNCRVDCDARFDELARLRRGLGRFDEKLTVAALGAPGAPPESVAALEDPDGRITAALGSRSLPARGLYLVDPLGNLMLRYTEDYQASDVLEDLERLLKYSKFSSQ